MRDLIEALRLRQASRAAGPPRTLSEIRSKFGPVGLRRSPPADVGVTRVDAGGVPAYWLDGLDAGEGRVLVYLHGGGYSLGSLASHGELAARLGRAAGARVFFPEYRLAPEHRFPAAFEDSLSAWRWLRDIAGVPSSSVVLAGDSAGGGLVVAVLQALRDADEALAAGAVVISPLVDLTFSGRSITERSGVDPIFTADTVRAIGPGYLGDADPRSPAASPLLASMTGLPPLLVQVGGAEVLLSDSERLAAAAAAAGVEVNLDVASGLPHVYQAARDTPEAARAISQVAEFAESSWRALGLRRSPVPQPLARPGRDDHEVGIEPSRPCPGRGEQL